MLYTSYFGNMKKIEEFYKNNNKNYIFISICGKAPDWYTGVQYKKLAPKYDFFIKWKENYDNDFYIREYDSRVLSVLEPHAVVKDLYRNISLSDVDINNLDIIFLCYEKPGDFCHRHLVSKWFNDSGIPCEELVV